MKLKDPICKKQETLQYVAAPIKFTAPRKRKKTTSTKTARKSTKRRTCRSCKK